MQEFVLAVLFIFSPTGEPVHVETLGVPTYADCLTLTQAASDAAKTQLPGFDVRTARISTEKIGQNGI